MPAGSTITNGDVSDASDLNIPFADIVADLNDARPIVAGGTGASSAAAARTNLGLAIGTNVQAYDATLTSIAALGTAADRIGYTTGVDTWAETAISSFGRSLIDDADATAAHGTLGTLAFLGNQIPNGATDLGAGADLNNFDAPGYYHQPTSANAASGTNYPVPYAGALEVYKAAGGIVAQVYTQYWRTTDGGPRRFYRSEFNNTWSPWHEIAAAPVGTSFACRAWVNFNGTGTPSIRASGNVSSITDLGTGKYRVNFATAMPDANYAVAALAHRSGVPHTNATVLGDGTKTASAVDVSSFLPGGTVSAVDAETINVAIFR